MSISDLNHLVSKADMASSHSSDGEELGERALEAINYFSPYPNFHFQRPVGEPGATGGALLFEETDDANVFKQNFVFKYFAENPDDGYDMVYLAEEELEALKMLRGAQHIVQLFGPGSVDINGRPCLLMEFVGYGTLRELLYRFTDNDRQMPQRLLWNIFLCLVRACVAMRYPPNGSAGDPVQKESIPEEKDPMGYTSIDHRDIHSQNILIDGSDDNDNEHDLGPLVKVIDFGYVELVPEESRRFNDVNGEATNDTNVDFNLPNMAEIMAGLANGEETTVVLDGREITIFNDDGEEVTFRTHAPVALDDLEMDTALQHLLYRCLDVDIDARPTLEEVLDICENAVLNLTAEDLQDLDYGLADWETDDSLREDLQHFILDADT
ncbi:kinase-like domain-containing protein [Xylariomycetidae sp. FL2044]|nr:kinase-like domain-containing protein [Xylariomycetidae sp. FL2044]